MGDVWTFTAIDAETKLIPSFLIGSRDAGIATSSYRTSSAAWSTAQPLAQREAGAAEGTSGGPCRIRLSIGLQAIPREVLGITFGVPADRFDGLDLEVNYIAPQ